MEFVSGAWKDLTKGRIIMLYVSKKAADQLDNDDISENCECVQENDPVANWIDKCPKYRGEEVEYLMSFNSEIAPSINENDCFQKAVKIGNWIFLFVLDRSFPKETEYGETPIRVYMVMPNMSEIRDKYQISTLPDVYTDKKGISYIYYQLTSYDMERYLSGCSEELLSENLIQKLSEWVTKTENIIFTSSRKVEKAKKGFWLTNRLFHHSVLDSQDKSLRPKYNDARRECSEQINPYCTKVVLSNRAYTQIFSETMSKIRTETGGLLLGHFDKGVWYVVEASDPGINATFTTAYHEGDDVYENHICGVISRMYKHPLVFLGMWHRHPGSLDVFSGTDDDTNYKYAGSAGNGCISALVNIDPEFRLTFYYVEQGSHRGSVYYTKVDIEIGNDKFVNPDIMELASPEDIVGRTTR